MKRPSLIVLALVAACGGGGEDLASPTVYPYRDDAPQTVMLFSANRNVTFSRPSLFDLPDGTLLAYSMKTEDQGTWESQDLLLRRSSDEGATWGDPDESQRAPTVVDRQRERLVAFWIFDNEGSVDHGRASIAGLDGVSWGPTIDVDPSDWAAGFPYHNLGDGAVQLDSGRLVIPIFGYDANGPERGVYLLRSDDGGESFAAGSVVELPDEPFAAPTLEVRTDGMLRVRVGDHVLISDDGSSLAVESDPPAPAPGSGAPLPYRTDQTDPRLLLVTQGAGEVGVAQSTDGGTTWDDPVAIHLRPSPPPAARLVAGGLLLMVHGVERTVPAPGGTGIEIDWMITRVGPGWLDAPVCGADVCGAGARSCDGGDVTVCPDLGAVCPTWSEPAPPCTIGVVTCDAGALLTCDEVDACAAFSAVPCPDAFCFDIDRCGESTQTSLPVGPDGAAFSLVLDGAGGAVVYASDYDFELDLADVDIHRLDAEGAVDWSLTIHNDLGTDEVLGAVTIDENGQIWAAGERSTGVHRIAADGSGSDKTELYGNYQSRRSIGPAAGGGVFVTGDAFAAGPFAARIGPDGTIVWNVQFGTEDDGYGYAVAAHPGGDAYVGGVSGNQALLQRQAAADGGAIWSRPWAGEVNALAVDGTDVLAAGPGEVRRYDEDGNLVWAVPIALYRVASVTRQLDSSVVIGGQDGEGRVTLVTVDASGTVTATLPFTIYDLARVDVQPSNEVIAIAGSHGVAWVRPAP